VPPGLNADDNGHTGVSKWVHYKFARRFPFYISTSSSELDTLQAAFDQTGGKWSTLIIWAKNTNHSAQVTAPCPSPP
jgi:hypothetical protein